MILLLILLAVTLIAAIIGALVGGEDFTPWDRYQTNWVDNTKAFFAYGGITFALLLPIPLIATAIGSSINQVSTNVTYSQPLASLKDGTGVEGRFSGGLFITRGYVNDTQHFAYYRVVALNQYVLEKRSATQSTIWTDATIETARVDITDKIYTCEPTWYMAYCVPNDNEFAHADFHIPAGSVEETYELDAQ